MVLLLLPRNSPSFGELFPLILSAIVPFVFMYSPFVSALSDTRGRTPSNVRSRIFSPQVFVPASSDMQESFIMVIIPCGRILPLSHSFERWYLLVPPQFAASASQFAVVILLPYFVLALFLVVDTLPLLEGHVLSPTIPCHWPRFLSLDLLC